MTMKRFLNSMLAAAVMFASFPLPSIASTSPNLPDILGSPQNLVLIAPTPRFPDRTKEAAAAQSYLAEQARVKQATDDCGTAGGVYTDNACVLPPPAPEPVYEAYTPSYTPPSSGLVGSTGWISGMANCVDFAKTYGKNQPGNPINWGISSRTPWIGAAALFYSNHVAIVVGIWGNGDVELAHANCPGCATRQSAGSLRGFF